MPSPVANAAHETELLRLWLHKISIFYRMSCYAALSSDNSFVSIRNAEYPSNRSSKHPRRSVLRKLRFFLFAAFLIALSSPSLHAQSGTTDRNGRQLTCASDDGRRHYCAADTRFGVRMLNQRSGSPCRQNYSWGYDRRGIWVDRGCRADFQLGR